MSDLSIPIEKAMVQQSTRILLAQNYFWVYALCSSVLPAWYAAALMFCWFRYCATNSVVRLVVANSRMDVRGRYVSDRNKVIKAFVFSLSLVILNCRLNRDKSGCVIRFFGRILKISQIYFVVERVAVAVRPRTRH